MSFAARRRAAAVPVLVALVACGDAPSAPRATTPLRLCSDAPFVAYQNAGGRWMHVAGEGGEFRIDATSSLGLAFAWPDRPLPYLVVEYHSAAQAATMHACGGAPRVEAPRTVQGRVRARSVAGGVAVKYGAAMANVGAGDSTFSLPPGEAADLVAANFGAGQAPDLMADRVILRRAQHLAAGTRVELDFTASEAFAPEMHTVRWTGEAGAVSVTFGTGLVQDVPLGVAYDVDGADAEHAVTVPVVPSSRTAPGDLHVFWLYGDVRSVFAYARAPGDLSLRFGPRAGALTLTNAAGARYRRVVAEVPSHPDYDAAVAVYLSQSNPNTSVQLSATREYFGRTPATWRLAVPDFSGVPAFPVIVAPKAGRIDWTLQLSSRPGPLSGPQSEPVDGQVVRTTLSTGWQD